MTEPAELKIKPGCEAGSKLCGKCVIPTRASESLPWMKKCPPFDDCVLKESGFGEPLRCQPCLESEKKMVNADMISVVIDDLSHTLSGNEHPRLDRVSVIERTIKSLKTLLEEEE